MSGVPRMHSMYPPAIFCSTLNLETFIIPADTPRMNPKNNPTAVTMMVHLSPPRSRGTDSHMTLY